MSRWHGGKGSTRRPEDKLAYDNGWDRIFNKKEYTPSNEEVIEHLKASPLDNRYDDEEEE
jgi:hypothetical protein